MNRIFTFFALLLSCALFGQNSSDAEVYSENGEPFYLILNGIRQNEQPVTNILVQGLTSSYYHAKIIFVEGGIPEIEQRYFRVQNTDDQWGKVTYAIKLNRKGEYKLRYRDFAPYAQMPPPASTVVVVPHNTQPMPAISGGVSVTETTTTTTNGSADNVNMGLNLGGVNLGVNVNLGGRNATTQSSTTTTTTTSSNTAVVYGTPNNTQVVHTQISAPVPGYTGRIGCNGFPMDQNRFSTALRSVQDKDFPNSRMSQAKQIASSNCLTAQQVKELVQTFDFENGKLDFAKYAYSRTIDIDNYFIVNDAFDFDHSVNQLNNYIR